MNPFRYRSYQYDDETGLYYLKSRYYDPETGRFINEDSFITLCDSLLGYNMFAYCSNNPITYCDPTGCWREIGNTIYIDNKYTYDTYYSDRRKWQPGKTYIYDPGYLRYNMAASPKVSFRPDGDYDDYYDENYNNRGSSSYKKEREREQIRSAWGSDRAERERNSRDLHDSKDGKRNDSNQSYQDLKDKNYWIEVGVGSFMVVGAIALGVYIVGNDITGVGVADDVPGLTAVIAMFKEGIEKFACA